MHMVDPYRCIMSHMSTGYMPDIVSKRSNRHYRIHCVQDVVSPQGHNLSE